MSVNRFVPTFTLNRSCPESLLLALCEEVALDSGRACPYDERTESRQALAVVAIRRTRAPRRARVPFWNCLVCMILPRPPRRGVLKNNKK